MSGGTPKFKMNDGDWVCPDTQCGNINFARRSSCNRCGKSMLTAEKEAKKNLLGHEIGKAAAEKSKGLFSADDWQCAKCGNVNWARRQHCNMCNAPRFGEVEERTGYGGGYNERENVEYVERVPSDSEYDDFGRKKKKGSGNGGKGDQNSSGSECSSHSQQEPTKESKPETPPPKEEKKVEKVIKNNDDDEEEEEEDDGDLSKYDLSGWDDDDDAATESKPKESVKRSRSRSSEGSRHRNSKSRSRSRSKSPRKRRRYSSDSRSRSSSEDSREGSRKRSQSPSSSSRDRESSTAKIRR